MSKEYQCWSGMVNRCTNPKNNKFHKYGSRGITVCERWRQFVNFLADMGHLPFVGAQLERKDNNGPYAPENCSWATRKRQARNKRTTRYLTLGDRTQCMADWADELGISIQTLSRRINQDGWSVEKALTTPIDTTRRNKKAKPVVAEPEKPGDNQTQL